MNKITKLPQQYGRNNIVSQILISKMKKTGLLFPFYSESTMLSKEKLHEKEIKRKYSDDYQMSEEEIYSILRKPQKKPNVLVETDIERKDIMSIYEKSIQEQIGQARFNTVKQFNTKLEASSKVDTEIQEFKPSDRPDVKYYKYELPIPNIDPEIEGLDDIFEREQKQKVTINQNIWSELQLDGESNYELYENELGKKYKFGIFKIMFKNFVELDMYGSEINVDQLRQTEVFFQQPEFLLNSYKLLEKRSYLSAKSQIQNI